MGCRNWMTSVNAWLGLQTFDPERVVTSNIVSPPFLFGYRFLCALYITTVWCVAIAYSKGKFFIFFTDLSYTGLGAYFWTVTFHSFQYVRNKDARSIREQPTCLTVALHMLYSTVVSFHVIIPIIYWSVLFDGRYAQPVEGWRDVSVHAMDFVLIFIEVILNRMQMTIKLFIVPFVVMLLYMFLTWIIRAVYGYWVYPFLSWQPRAGYIYPCIAIFLGLVYCVVYSVHLLKEHIWETRRSQAAAMNGEQQDANGVDSFSMNSAPTYPAPVYATRGGL